MLPGRFFWWGALWGLGAFALPPPEQNPCGIGQKPTDGNGNPDAVDPQRRQCRQGVCQQDPGAQGADGEDHRHGGAVHCPEIAVEEEKNADAQVERGLNAEIACADGDHLRSIPAHKGGHEPGRQQTNQTADDNKSGKWTWNSDTIWVHIYNNGKKVESGAKSDIIFEKTPVAGDEITYVYIAKNDKQLAELIYVIDGEFTATVYDDDAKASERVGNINAFLATNGYTSADLTTLKTEMEGYLTKDISAAVKADVEAVIKALADAQTALTANQTAAKAELNSYKETALNTYEDKLTGTEVREIEAIVSAANADIDAAAKNAIDGIVTQAKSDIDGKTTGAAGALADEKKVKDAKAALGDVTLSPVASTSAPDADAIKAKLPAAADGVTYAVSAPSWGSITAGEEDTFTATVTVTITAGEAQDTKEIQASYVATDYKTVKDAVDGIGKAVSVEVSSSGIDANAAETALKSALESKYTGTTITADIAGNVTGSEGDVVTKSFHYCGCWVCQLYDRWCGRHNYSDCLISPDKITS